MLQGPKDYLKIGDWNAWCDRCGFKMKASELRREWQGFMVCAGCWEPRNQQDLIRSIPEMPAPPFSRPRNDSVPSSPVWVYSCWQYGAWIDDPVWDAAMKDLAGTTLFSTYGPVNRNLL